MSISDAEFAQWLKDGKQRRVILIEQDFVYQVVVDATHGTPTVGTLYFSDYPFVTEPGDTPANHRYRDRIEAVPGLEQSIDTDTLGGQAKLSIGGVTYANPDGDLDFMLALNVDGRECRVYLGSPTWARADFRNVMTAIAEINFAPGLNQIGTVLKDRGLLLDSSLVGTLIGGTGPNAGRPLPIVAGFCNNVEAILIDAATLTYGVADGAANPITVFDSGYELEDETPLLSALGSTFTVDPTADTISHSSLNLAIDDILTFATVATMGITSGAAYFVVATNLDRSFQISATRSGLPLNLTGSFSPGETVLVNRYPSLDNLDTPRTITLAHPPSGRVTVNVDVPILTNSRVSDLLYHFVVTRAGVPSGNFSGPLDSFDEDDDACDFHLGKAITDRVNTADVADDIVFSANGFWTFDRLSNFVYGRIRPWDLGSLPVVLELASDDIADLNAVQVQHLAPTYKEIRAFFQRSWTEQTDGFAGAISLDRINYLQAGGLFYGTQPITSTRYEDNPGVFHSTMITSPDYVTLLSQQVCDDAFAEFETWLEDRRQQTLPSLELISFPAKLSAYDLKLGDVVNFTLDRYGLDAGELFQVVGYKLNLTAASVGLTLLRRHVVDFSTTAYL